jgi:glycosyltransferase involved in cell wall biosynthesis
MPPKVSVIVPNYNHARFLRQRLDSIFNQTFQDFEVIILDDCSTDNSKEVIEEYRNRSQVSHIVYNETNSGSPFKQWAKGFDLAQGEYIWIAESDDWAELIFLEELVPKLIDEKIALAFCNSKLIYPNKTDVDIKDVYEDILYEGQWLIRNKMSSSNYILNASSVLFKKCCLDKISKTYQSFLSSGDWLFWIEICQCGDVFFSSKMLNYNNRHGYNTTSLWGNRMITGVAHLEDIQIFSFLLKHKYISFFQKNVIIQNHLEWFDQNKDRYVSKQVYQDVRDAWRKEIFSEFLSKIIITMGVIVYKILLLFKLKK